MCYSIVHARCFIIINWSYFVYLVFLFNLREDDTTAIIFTVESVKEGKSRARYDNCGDINNCDRRYFFSYSIIAFTGNYVFFILMITKLIHTIYSILHILSNTNFVIL